jgi:LysM repeat protein
MNDRYLEKIRKLTRILFLSGAINIILLTLLFYVLIKERPPTPYYEWKPADKKEQQAPIAISYTNAELLRQFRKLSKEQLAAKLSNAQLVENGYTQRDLALAALVRYHHFDLSRALVGHVYSDQKRTIIFGKLPNGSPAEMTILPGLTDTHYQAIMSFVQREEWPLTSQGLFLQLKRDDQKNLSSSQSLLDSFYLTPEFLSVETLFSRSGVVVDKLNLLKVVLEGDWNALSSFAEQQKSAQDLTPARRQAFLLHAVDQGSHSAAELLLKTDADFAARKLNDASILKLLALLDEKTPAAEQFALSQLTSPRTDAVWKMAAERLYGYVGEKLPEKNQHHAALERFVEKSSIVAVANPQPQTILPPIKPQKTPVCPYPKQTKNQQSVKYYVVQEGDSLWKISRAYKVDIEKIKKFNCLGSDFLKPGTILKIPIS